MKKIFITLFFLQSIVLNAQNSLIKKGQEYLKSGRNDLALETLTLAERNLTSSDDLNAAECYNTLGTVFWLNENRKTAMDYYEKALSIRKDKLEAGDPLIADIYLNIGDIFLKDEFLQAIIYFEKALEIYKKAYGENHPKVALCYTNLAFAYRFQGNYRDALTYLNQTMKIWEDTYQEDHPNKALTISNKGRILEGQGIYDEALKLQQEALQQYLALYGDKHPEVANTYWLIGSVQTKQHKYVEALESFQKSIYANLYDQQYTTIYDLPEIRNCYNPDYLLSSLQYKAQTLEALHFEKTLKPRDIRVALETYKKCDEVITDIRQQRLSEADKIRIGGIASEVYDDGIRIALYLSGKTFKKDKYNELAFTFCERSKSATLLEAINETNAKHFAGIPNHLITMEDSLKAEISWLEKELAKPNNDSERYKERLFNYQQSYRAFISQLEKEYPSYYQLKYEKREISVAEIQQELPPRAAMLSYFIGENAVYVFYISNKGMEVHSYPTERNLFQISSGLRNSIKYHIEKGFQESAYTLYQQLIPPIGKEIYQLIILPDGILGTIPFETFITQNPLENKPHYLIEDYAISYDYAASLYISRLSSVSKDIPISGIFLSAPVSFDRNDMKMPALPGSEEEVQQIRYLFLSGKDKPTVCLNEKASEASLKSGKLQNYKYLHFATHGIVNESKPELSRIFLSPDEEEDGSLYSGEIYNLNINADLVTLSACETGLGKVEKGEGIVGLSRSLMYAGAKNLIVSLWQVADASTSQLMIDFYTQHLYHSNNNIFSDDLRKAKLNFIKGSQFQDPYYWAPFVLIGH